MRVLIWECESVCVWQSEQNREQPILYVNRQMEYTISILYSLLTLRSATRMKTDCKRDSSKNTTWWTRFDLIKLGLVNYRALGTRLRFQLIKICTVVPETVPFCNTFGANGFLSRKKKERAKRKWFIWIKAHNYNLRSERNSTEIVGQKNALQPMKKNENAL